MERPDERTLSPEAKEYITYLENRLENMSAMYRNLQKAHFGSKSEKQKPLTVLPADCEQLSIFNEAEDAADAKAKDPTALPESTVEVKSHKRARKRSREELLDGLPVEIHEYELPAEEQVCRRCGHALEKIGREYIRKECEYIPAQVKVHEYYRATYACRGCEDGMPECEGCERADMDVCAKCENRPGMVLVKADVPEGHRYPVLKHSIASASTVAQVLYDKYVMAIPMYRQVQDWERAGLKMNRATLANWVLAVDRDYFAPLWKHMKTELLKSSVLHCDETTVQVLKEPGRTPTSESYMWAYRSGEHEEKQIVLFDYQPGRSGDYAKKFLEGYDGYFVTDGYAGYSKVTNGTRCGCWAHVRRKFLEAIPGSDPNGEQAQGSKAKEGFEFCEKLFMLEREFAGLSPAERQTEREKRSRPVLEAFWTWCSSIDALRNSPLSKAVGYATGQKQILGSFLLNGRIPISNNLDENAIRPFVMGRKNWLFCNTPNGATASAAVYSIVETAKANGLDPYKYLKYLLEQMPCAGGRYSCDFLDMLAPWNQQLQKLCR
ncbi:MAG: IS66 family transposase [Ruminococcus sp.]|nr:IS66 family transposase [Oscillospiraceae bacterium]MBQ8906441.1 IS66 family transposase [Ruminococcus sp.]